MSRATYWNGERAPARRVWITVADSEAPHYWARGLIGQRRAAVEVEYPPGSGDTFLLDDEEWTPDEEFSAVVRGLGGTPRGHAAGEGWEKVTTGMGSPQRPHASVYAAPGSVEPRDVTSRA